MKGPIPGSWPSWGSRPSTRPVVDGRIAFAGVNIGEFDLYAIAPDGSGLTRLTDDPADDNWPTYSPDGSQIAFFSNRDGTDGIWVMEADGTDPRKIAEGGEPNWSPHLHPHQRGIALIDVDRVLAGDEAAVQILTRTEADVPEEAPAWSPNGERIAFTSHRSGSSDIWMVDIDGGDLHNLTPEPSLESAASWSPDGRHIVFGSNRAASSVEGGDLFTMRPDGTDPQRLTDEGLSYRPAWSPDGRWIAFNSQRDGDSEVYAMHPDGTGQRRLTAHPETDGLPAWVGRCDSQT